MRMKVRALLATALALSLLTEPADAAPLDEATFKQALAAARLYRVDRGTLNYCLRQNAEKVLSLMVGLNVEIDEALRRLKAAGATDLQAALFVETVLSRVYYWRPHAASDAAIDKICVRDDPATSLDQAKGVGRPLWARPPFDKWGR